MLFARMGSRAQTTHPALSLHPVRLAGWREVALATAAFGAALFAIWRLVPLYGLSVSTLLTVPLAMLAWSFGLKGALLGSALALPVGMIVCLHALREPLLLSVTSAHVGILFIACVTGRLRDLSVRIGRELEEHARAVRLLRHGEARNQALLGALPDLIFRLDASGKMSGASGGRGQGTSMRSATYLDQLLPVEVAELMRERVRAVLQSGQASELEYRVTEQEAGDYEARLVKCAPDQVLVIVRNVTRQKRLERELIAAKEAALEAARSKTKFLANMSHEIRTPMNGVIGMTHLLLETQLGQEQREYASIIQKSGQSLLAIIDDILDFAKIEAGRLELDRIEFDLHGSIEDSLEAFAGQALAKGLDLGCVFDGAVPPKVLGDPTRLRQVLAHLIGNAVKYTDEGAVRVEVEPVREQPGRVRVRVRDTGPGVAPELRSRLFRPLLLDEDGAGMSTGLGLAIARELVQLMDGEIHYEGESEGAVFSFEVRFDLPAGLTRDAPSDFAGARVLLVRPSGAPRRVLDAQLESLGLQPEHADAAQALAVLRAARAGGKGHLAVLIEAVRDRASDARIVAALRGDAALERVPVVLILAREAHPALDDDLRRSATRVLEWPVRRAELVGCLSALLGRSEPLAPAAAPQPAASTLDARVLVAEDNPINQRVALRTLQLLGCRVEVAEDGQQAVEAALGSAFDVVLMDCQMPVMDGFEATRQIRAREQGRRTPIVAMTAGISDDDRERCREVDMDGYITKPVTLEQLRDAIAKVIAPVQPAAQPDATAAHDAVIERQALDELRDLGGDDPAFLRDLVQMFFEQAPRHIEVARVALGVGDLEAAGKAAHTLKSSSGYLGARRLAALCKHLEMRARAGDTAEVGRTIEALTAEYDAVRHALSSEVG